MNVDSAPDGTPDEAPEGTDLLATVGAVGIATVQDGGRAGWAHAGVPISGPLHVERYHQAALLMRGVPDRTVPAIEILDGRFALCVHTSTQVAAVGPARVTIAGRSVGTGGVIAVAAGNEIVVERSPANPDAGPVYVVVGGWEPPRVLGSAATDTFSGLGGDRLHTGHRLTGHASGDLDRVGWFCRPLRADTGPIRVVPHGVGLPLSDQSWQVAAVSRSGIRLTGDRTAHAQSAAGESQPVVPGAIQLTPSGEAIILGPDGGVTGGYPVAGVVATIDRDRLSTLPPGAAVRFAAVDVETAVAAAHARQRRLRHSLDHPDHAR